MSRVRIHELAQAIERRGDKLRDVQRRLSQASAQLGPRGRATAALVERAISDTRAELCLDPATASRVRQACTRADQLAAEYTRNAPATVTATSEWNDTDYGALQVLDGDPSTSWLCKDRPDVWQ